jgi:hypothetical protein
MWDVGVKAMTNHGWVEEAQKERVPVLRPPLYPMGMDAPSICSRCISGFAGNESYVSRLLFVLGQ